MTAPRETYLERFAIQSDTSGDFENFWALKDFIEQNYRVTNSRLTAGEVKDSIQTSGQVILQDYRELRDILERHEVTIRRRWSNKTKRSKRGLLARAWGSPLPLTHRPDFQAWETDMNLPNPIETRFRNCYMFPYINEQDLLKPGNMLLLLNSRGRYHPSEFAAADLNSMRLGLIMKTIVPPYAGYQFVLLHGHTAVNDYGRLMRAVTPSDVLRNPELVFSTCDQMEVAEALLILSVQEILMKFLVRVCRQILHDIDSGMITSKMYPILLEPQFLELESELSFDLVDVMATQAPYRVPAQISFQRLTEVLRARLDAAKDHLWTLTEDPGYLSDHLAEMKEHRPENIKEESGRVHRMMRPGNEITFSAIIIGATVVKAMTDIHVYTELLEAAELLERASKERDNFPLDQDINEDFTYVASLFRTHLSGAMGRLLKELRWSMAASPQLRDHFFCEPVSYHRGQIKDPVGTFSRRTGPRLQQSQERVFKICGILWDGGPILKLLGIPLVLDELDRLISADVEARKLISAHVASIIGDLSMVSQCYVELTLCHPLMQNMSKFLKVFPRGMIAFAVETDRAMESYDNALWRINTFLPAARILEPWSAKLSYPSGKRLNKTISETLRRSEHTLDSFWAAIDHEVHQRSKPSGGNFLDRFLPQGRILKRTPEWLVQYTCPPVLDATLEEPQVETLSRNLYDCPEKGQKGRNLCRPSVRTKTKTRGSLTATFNSVASLQRPKSESSLTEAKPNCIAVDTRAIKVFRTVFHDPEVTSTPGEIRWTDFLHAMASAGFSYGKSRGSSWYFIKREKTDHHRITFHEPHPNDKLSYENARRNGRRLTLNYGWTGETFILKNKDASSSGGGLTLSKSEEV